MVLSLIKYKNYELTENYEESKELAEKLFNQHKKDFYMSFHEDYEITEGLKTDTYKLIAEKEKSIILITTGEHGIESYAGDLFLQIFFDKIYKKNDLKEVSVYFIHSLNPWGMKNKRRVNENNIDLNRNFLENFTAYKNHKYEKLDSFFNPKTELKNISDVSVFFKIMGALLKTGKKGLVEAFASGQFSYPEGVYYGGKSKQKSVKYAVSQYEKIFKKNKNILHIDIHTGAGPRNRMSIVNSEYFGYSSQEFIKLTGYDIVSKTDADEFYKIHGDMIDYIHKRYIKNNREILSTCFEYGTYGADLKGLMKTLKALINENQIRHHGAADENIKNEALKEFKNLFYPLHDNQWLENFEKDTEKALKGIIELKKIGL